MNIPQLKDQADFRQGYQMVKPTHMRLWDQVQMMFEISRDHEPSLANRNAILNRMFPDVHCEFDTTDFFARSMWESFFDQRVVHSHLNDPEDGSEDGEPQPKKSKAETALKGKTVVIDSDEDSPPREPEPSPKYQSWAWDHFLHQRAQWNRHPEPKSERMFMAGRKLSETVDGFKRASILTANRRMLEEARRHTSEEVQGLRDSLAKAQREL